MPVSRRDQNQERFLNLVSTLNRPHLFLVSTILLVETTLVASSSYLDLFYLLSSGTTSSVGSPADVKPHSDDQVGVSPSSSSLSSLCPLNSHSRPPVLYALQVN